MIGLVTPTARIGKAKGRILPHATPQPVLSGKPKKGKKR